MATAVVAADLIHREYVQMNEFLLCVCESDVFVNEVFFSFHSCFSFILCNGREIIVHVSSRLGNWPLSFKYVVIVRKKTFQLIAFRFQ